MAQAVSLFDLGPARSPEIQQAINLMATSGIEERGAVFTRREVVEFILDLAGYQTDGNLLECRLLEPSCGRGDFLLVALERLLDAFNRAGGRMEDASATLRDAIRAVELHQETFRTIQARVRALLLAAGVPQTAADELIGTWLLQDDFLLADLPAGFTHIVGNPPYVRQERIPGVLLAHYRVRYRTIYDRADLYIPFIERSLELLAPEGRLAFICADRWMKNKYGGPLRTLIAKRCHLEHYVDMTGTDAFHSAVSAYPAIVVLAGGQARDATTRVVHRPAVDGPSLQRLARRMGQSGHIDAAEDIEIQEIAQVAKGSAPWVFSTSHDVLAILRHLERTFPLLEATGCKVGIGVATGCDRVYIGPMDELPVEPDRKLPLVMSPDIRSSRIVWSGKGIINPFTENGDLVPLGHYPQLAAYLAAHEQAIRKRNVAQTHPKRWYRTIDRIYPALTCTPKLLIPDIKGDANVVYDAGNYYPHHNLYYVTAAEWDLHALQAMLRSAIARVFVASYSVKMRGDFLRFQAQYIRRIHLPSWHSLSLVLQTQLRDAALASDWAAANEIACDAYQLSPADGARLLQAASMQ